MNISLRFIYSAFFLFLYFINSSVQAEALCGEKTLERQAPVTANQSYCLTDYGHYLWVYIPYNNSDVTITTSGGIFSGSNSTSIDLFSDGSWDNDKLVSQVYTPDTNEESLSFVSGIGNYYFYLGGDVSEMTLQVTVSGGDIPDPLADFIVFNTDISINIPAAVLTTKSDFSSIVNQIIAAQISEYQTIAENNSGSILDVAQALHFLAEQDNISDSDFEQLMPFINKYNLYGDEVTNDEALAINNALLAVATMTDFLTTGFSAGDIQKLYFSALSLFTNGTFSSYYSEHLPHLLAVVQFYSLQADPFTIEGASESFFDAFVVMREHLFSGENGVINTYTSQMLDVLSVLRSFVLLGGTSLDRRWTKDNDLTWFTYYSYYLLAEIYEIANEDAQSRINGIFKEIHQTQIPEVEQLFLETTITKNFIERAGRECSVDDPLYGYCWIRPKEVDILTVSYDCSANLTIRAQSSITADTLQNSCEKMTELEANFHGVFSTQGSPLAGDRNTHLEVVVFASPDDYDLYAGEFFGISTDNGGIYLEGSPSVDGNQARFIAMQCPEGWVGSTCENADDIYNLEHEFIHYLDGHYIKDGSYEHYDYVVAWSEGLSEYLVNGEDHSRTLIAVDGLDIPPLYNVLFADYDYDELYAWSYFAIRFLAEDHQEDFQLLATTLKAGNNSAFTATLRAISDQYETEFEAYVLGKSSAIAPVETIIPEDDTFGSCTLAQQYTIKYDAPDADSLTVTNNTSVPISLFWINNTTGKPYGNKYQTLALGESYTATYWTQTDRMMLIDNNRNCIAIAVLTAAVNDFIIEEKDVENIVPEIIPEADELGSCELMNPHIPFLADHEFTVTNTTNYPVHIFRVDDKTGEPIYSKLYDTLLSGESYSSRSWYGNRRIMLADTRLNCLAVAVTDNIVANFYIDDLVVASAALPEILPEDNTIGSCDLMEKHLIEDVSYTFSITNTTDADINIYRVDNNKGEMESDNLYDTLSMGETFTSEDWFGQRRVVITDDKDQCLGIAVLNQKDVLNEFIVTGEHVDSDGDGIVDAEDAFPEDATETLDSDGDGIGDNSDAFPEDATETLDSDGDGIGDNSDAYPNDPHQQYTVQPSNRRGGSSEGVFLLMLMLAFIRFKKVNKLS